jgi:flagellin-like hook-associated protein FlgL
MRTQSDSIDQQISGEVSADLADTMVQLNQTQVAYQAALQGGARILNLSLLDYLR